MIDGLGRGIRSRSRATGRRGPSRQIAQGGFGKKLTQQEIELADFARGGRLAGGDAHDRLARSAPGRHLSQSASKRTLGLAAGPDTRTSAASMPSIEVPEINPPNIRDISRIRFLKPSFTSRREQRCSVGLFCRFAACPDRQGKPRSYKTGPRHLAFGPTRIGVGRFANRPNFPLFPSVRFTCG